MNSFRLRYQYLLAAMMIFCTAQNAFAFMGGLHMQEVESDNLRPFNKWTSAMERAADQFDIDDEECDKISFHPCIVSEWKTFLEDLKSKSLEEKLDAINDWGNAHPYIVDQLNWGKNDYWETPYEFMAINGDCEDYAIAKYYSLRRMGVDADQMRIMIVQDNNLGGIIHAILGVRDGNDYWILDNQIKGLTHASSIYHYRPIYAVNEDKWWRYVQQ